MALLVELYSLRLVLSAGAERIDWQALLATVSPLLLLSFPHPPFLSSVLFHFPFSPLSTALLSSVMGNARSLPQVIAFSRMQSNVLSPLSFFPSVSFAIKQITLTTRSPYSWTKMNLQIMHLLHCYAFLYAKQIEFTFNFSPVMKNTQ